MSVSTDTASVDDALRNALVVESVNLLHSDLILEESRTSAFRVRGLQPDIEQKTQHKKTGERRVSNQV